MIHFHIAVTSERGNVTSVVYSTVHESDFSISVFCQQPKPLESMASSMAMELRQRTSVSVHPLYFDLAAIWRVRELSKVGYQRRQAIIRPYEIVWETYNARFEQVCLEFVVVGSRTWDS